MKSVNAIIKLEVPEYQIGEPVTVYFKDTMQKSGICEKEEVPIPDINQTYKQLKALRKAMSDNQCYTCSKEFVDVVNEFGTNILDNAISLLKEQETAEIEIEYGGATWWYVCEECRGLVDRYDKFCRHCGRTFVDSVKK